MKARNWFTDPQEKWHKQPQPQPYAEPYEYDCSECGTHIHDARGKLNKFNICEKCVIRINQRSARTYLFAGYGPNGYNMEWHNKTKYYMVPCPLCNAPAGEPCRSKYKSPDGNTLYRTNNHGERKRAWQQYREDASPAYRYAMQLHGYDTPQR